MNKLKKSLALVALLAVASTAFVGCGDSSSTGDSSSKPADQSSEESKPTDESSEESKTDDGSSEAPKAENKFKDDDETLSLLCWTPDDVTKMIEKFGNDKVKYVNVGAKGQEAREKYATYFQGDEDVDLFVLEADWIRDYINNDDYCADLTDLGFTAADFEGSYDYVRAIGTNDNGVLKATSWQATPGAYVYRTDLAEEILGAKTRDEMQALCKDWTEFEKTAEKAAAKNVSMVDSLGGLWQVYQYNKPSKWVEDGKLVVDDYCKEYTELAKKWYDKGYISKKQQWAEDGSWLAQGSDGSNMGYFFATWSLGKGSQLETAEGESAKGKYNICAGPSSYAWGGSWLAVSPKCNTGTLAHDFVEYFTVNPKTMEEYALFKGEFVNNPTVMKKIVDDKSNKNELLGGEDQFAVLYEAASKIDLDGKVTKYDAQVKDAFNGAVQGYINGDTADVDSTINEFKKKVASSVEGVTVE